MSRARRNSTGRLRLVPAVLGLGVAAALGVAGCGAGQITQTDTQLPAVNGGMGQAGQVALRNIQLAYVEGGAYPQGGDATVTGTIVNIGGTADELLSVSSPVAALVTVEGDKSLLGRKTLVAEQGQESGSESSAPAVTSTPSTSTPSTSTPSTSTPSTSTPSTSTPSASSSSSSAPTSGSSAASSGAPSSGASASGSAAPQSSTAMPSTTVTLNPQTGAVESIGKVVIRLTGLKQPVRSGKTIPLTFVFRNAGPVTVEVPVAVPTTPRQAAEQPADGEGH